MNYEILINKILRIPMKKAAKLLENYQKNIGFKNFAEQQRVLDAITHKSNAQKRIKEEAFQEAAFSLCLMSRNKNILSKSAYENIKSFPMIIWIEAMGFLEDKEIMSILNNYHQELPPLLIETFIINLTDEKQLIAIEKYNKFLDKNSELFTNFYYSICKKAREKVKTIFPDKIEDDILLELEDLTEQEVAKRLLTDKDRLLKIPSDKLIEFILLKASSINLINTFIKLFNEKISDSSDFKFKLLFTRYKYLSNTRSSLRNSKEDKEYFNDNELFNLFQKKFHKIGIEETLSLFNNITHYKSNKFTVDVISEFIDIAYADEEISKYINNETIIEIINKFVTKCQEKNYSIEDFENLINNIEKNNKTKLISDNYIEAIIACGKLLKERIITDKHPLFIKLREKFSKDLISRSKKDGTYLENISLNGIFYRLAKGNMPFEKVYMTKTYKGLIYLSKCGQLIDNADYITNFLTDEQLAILNITPLIRWKKEINRSNTNADNLSFIERMGLQLLCYFGKDKGKYLLESNMQGNRMENLFDGLKYSETSINEDGTPKINKELIDYLFGKGAMKESNSVINRMIRGEIPNFEKYFTEFCNSFSEVKQACNGVLSVKRIIKYYEEIDFPIELKPDEIEFKRALYEMNTLDEKLLSEAIQLCKDARKRKYSTIPKVEGQIGDFTYKILDLNDPLAIAVGYLSHCCFVVRGISYSALKHSMQSVNGRTFVVYYKGQFLTQSWVWRNGDAICFDSVEAGSPYHGMYNDDIKLIDVYKRAAEEMLYTSQMNEDDIQRVKVVTIGKSDYTFKDLEKLEGDVPRPLENDVYVYDSLRQNILAGAMPKEPRYGVVGAKYKDPKPKVTFINEVSESYIDILDEVALNINSLRYQIYGNEQPMDYTNYYKIIASKDWYILFNNDGSIENGVLPDNEEVIEEFKKYLSRYTKSDNLSNNPPIIKKLNPLTGNNG